MAKTDFYPTSDGRKLSFLDHLLHAVNTNQTGETLGLSAADLAALAAARTELHNAVSEKLAKKNAAQAATAAWKAVDKRTEAFIRASIRRIRTHAAYTPALGELLGVEGPATASPGSSTHLRPDLAAVSVRHGEVTLSYLKHGFSGVEIRSKRGQEKEYTFLARDTQAPYIDTRPNQSLNPEKPNDSPPETRYYIAQYLLKDKPVGEISDVLVVTVPGKG